MTEKTPPVDVLRDDPPSADVDVAKLRLELNHMSLEELVEDRLVKWDRENNVIIKGPYFDRRQPLKS